MLDADGLAFLRADQGDIEPGNVVPVRRLPVASRVYAVACRLYAKEDAIIKCFR
jgi:hypothetical protein